MTMTFEEYSEQAKKTSMYPAIGFGDLAKIIYPSIKLAGETGEFMEKIGKIIRDDDGRISSTRQLQLAMELGDILWYWAALIRELDLEPSFVAQLNLEKLLDRQTRGTIQGEGDVR